ncbi:MAG: hypothetical protein JWR35_3464 [Marmoricola sp.]|nr:hypothetical protein [Marmoricola sp.]
MVNLPDLILTPTFEQPPTLGAARFICVDGPAGSGKTTLGRALASAEGTRLVHMDDLYPGWDGLAAVDEHVLGLVTPLAADQPGSYRRYDWDLDEYAETVTVSPSPLLVLEGVGSGNSAWSHLITTLVWVEAPDDVRLRRGLDRDGEHAREHWLSWMEQETSLFAREATRERADFIIDAS